MNFELIVFALIFGFLYVSLRFKLLTWFGQKFNSEDNKRAGWALMIFYLILAIALCIAAYFGYIYEPLNRSSWGK
jgi:hypothetical protein